MIHFTHKYHTENPCYPDLVWHVGTLLRKAFILGTHPSCGLMVAVGQYKDVVSLDLIMSVIPRAPRLSDIEVHLAQSPSANRLMRLCWLAYALYHPAQYQLPLESLEIKCNALNESEQAYYDFICRSGVPLRDVVSISLRSRFGRRFASLQVECYLHGTGALVRRGARLASGAFPQAVIALSEDEIVGLVVFVRAEELIGVVYPGFELLWVNSANVSEMAPPPGPLRAHSAVLGALVAPRSLSIETSGLGLDNSLPPMHFYASANFVHLKLSHLTISSNDLCKLLHHFPRLEYLGLSYCQLESLRSLIVYPPHAESLH